MPTFQFTIDAYIFILIISVAVLAGFWGRSRQLAKKDRRILELEKEMLHAHAEVLNIQREYYELEARIASATSPVIAMKNNKNDEPHRPTGTD